MNFYQIKSDTSKSFYKYKVLKPVIKKRR